jgi:hypothetical protein
MNEEALTCWECGARLHVVPGKQPQCRRCRAMRRELASAEPGPLLDGTEEDDGKPYRVPGDPDQKEPCPQCQKEVPRGAVVCNHCGFNRETGTKVQRVHKKVDKEWEPGLGFKVRLSIFLGCQGLALTATMIVAFADGDWIGLLIAWMTSGTMLAFVLGTFPRVNVVRSKKGQVRMSKTWRVCFLPMGTTEINWREYEGVVTTLAHHSDIWDWFILFTLMPWGLVPAVLWWYYVMEADQFDVALTRDHGSPAMLLYRGHSETIAKEIAATVRNVTGLPER